MALDPSRVRRVRLEAVTGRKLVVRIPNDDSARDPEDLTGHTAFGKIVDEDGTTIMTLSPTTGGAAGTYLISEVITSGLTSGHYRWKGGLIDSAGDEEVRYEGPFLIRKHIVNPSPSGATVGLLTEEGSFLATEGGDILVAEQQ